MPCDVTQKNILCTYRKPQTISLITEHTLHTVFSLVEDELANKKHESNTGFGALVEITQMLTVLSVA